MINKSKQLCESPENLSASQNLLKNSNCCWKLHELCLPLPKFFTTLHFRAHDMHTILQLVPRTAWSGSLPVTDCIACSAISPVPPFWFMAAAAHTLAVQTDSYVILNSWHYASVASLAAAAVAAVHSLVVSACQQVVRKLIEYFSLVAQNIHARFMFRVLVPTALEALFWFWPVQTMPTGKVAN